MANQKPPTTGLVSWFQSSAGVTDLNARVSQWNDLSGGALNATQATGGIQPVSLENDFISSIRFARDRADAMTLPSGLSLNRRNFSVFMVLNNYNRYESAGGIGFQTFYGTFGGVSVANNSGNDNFITTYDGSSLIESNLLDGLGLNMLGIVSSGTKYDVYLNSETGTGTTLASGTATGGSLGASIWQGNEEYKEILVYDHACTTNEITQIKDYLRNRYNYSINRTNIVFDGDSITYGSGCTAFETYPSYLIGLRRDIKAINLGVGGKLLTQMISTAPTWVDPQINRNLRYNISVIFGGTNDLYFGGRTPAQVYADTQTYVAARKSAGWDKVIVTTILPRDPLTNAGFEADRQTFNTLLRNGYASFADGLVDIGADVNMGLVGQYADTNYYSDGTHPSSGGNVIIANLMNQTISLFAPPIIANGAGMFLLTQ